MCSNQPKREGRTKNSPKKHILEHSSIISSSIIISRQLSISRSRNDTYTIYDHAPSPPPRIGDPNKKKKKGRAPAHQNGFAFRHNPKSKKTEKILASPNVGVCVKCRDKIEWRKRYRKVSETRAERARRGEARRGRWHILSSSSRLRSVRGGDGHACRR